MRKVKYQQDHDFQKFTDLLFNYMQYYTLLYINILCIRIMFIFLVRFDVTYTPYILIRNVYDLTNIDLILYGVMYKRS